MCVLNFAGVADWSFHNLNNINSYVDPHFPKQFLITGQYMYYTLYQFKESIVGPEEWIQDRIGWQL